MISIRPFSSAAAALAVSVTALLSPPARAGDPAPPPPSMERADWASDLDVLYAAMKEEHPALHHKTSAAEMDAYVAAFHKAIPHDTWPEYVMGLYGLLALVGDGHTAFYPVPDAGPGFDSRYPVLTTVFADGIYVTSADPVYRDAVGGKVVAIGGHPIAEIFRTASAHWDHDNEMWVLRWMPLMLRRPGYLAGMHIVGAGATAPAVFTILKDGQTRDIAVTPVLLAADDASQAAGWVKARDDTKITPPTPLHGTDVSHDFVYLEKDRAVYAVYREVADSDKETVAAFAARLFKFIDEHKVDKLIFDIRENGGGDNYLNQPLLVGMIQARGIDRPGHLFVLTGPQTFSAAQNFANQAERWTEALFAGTPTASSPNFYGDARQMTLPKTQLHPMVSTLYWQDSEPRDKRIWIMPDLPAQNTFADYMAGRDRALEAALAYKADDTATPTAPDTHWSRKNQDAAWPMPFGGK